MKHLRADTSPVELRDLRDDLRAWLNARFGGQSGWLCLGWIDGDPKIEPMREEWYELPRQSRRATERYLELAERGYNLYVGQSLHSEPTRGYATALPAHWLWLDDTAIEGAELVESSAGNYQSWLKLDQPITATERSALQRAIRDASAGADTCSSNAVHMARVPGGWNRKRHGAWRVVVAQEATQIFTIEELRERFPAATQRAVSPDAVGDWSSLPSGEKLASSARFKRLVEANEQLRKVCAGEPVRVGTDTSTSAQRAVFVNQLIRAHYPHDEIRALAEHFDGVLDSGRGWRVFQIDIDRLLAKYTPAGYKPEATRGTPQQAQSPRGGRHYELTAAELLDFYHSRADCGPIGLILDWTIGEVAAWLGVSHGTVKRREAELVAAGEIRREYGRVILSVATAQIGSQRIEMPETSDGTVDIAIRSQFDLAHCDAANEAFETQCVERACEDHEITHHPSDEPDRDLLSRVRALARQVDEPSWYQRDYDAWSNDALLAEATRLAAVVAPELDAPGASYAEILDWTQPGGVCAVPRQLAEYQKPDWLRAAGSLSGDWEPRETTAENGDQQVLDLGDLAQAQPGGCVLSLAIETQKPLFAMEEINGEPLDQMRPVRSDHPSHLGDQSMAFARPLRRRASTTWPSCRTCAGRAGASGDCQCGTQSLPRGTDQPLSNAQSGKQDFVALLC